MPTDQPTYAGISPQFVGDSTPSLYSYGPRPYVLTGALVQHFRQHFSDPFCIEEPSLRASLWKPDEATGIVIESITRWDPKAAMKRPAIVIRRGPVQFVRRGIGDLCMGFIVGDDGIDRYAAFMAGWHSIFCLGNEAGEAERLAAEVYREVLQFGPVLRGCLRLHRLGITELGEVHRLPQEAAGGYAAPVTIAYAYEESWEIVPQVPVLQGVSVEARP